MRAAGIALRLALAAALASGPPLAAWDLRSYTGLSLDRRPPAEAGDPAVLDLLAEQTLLARLRGLTLIGKAAQGFSAGEATKTQAGLGLSFGYAGGSCYSSLVLGAAYDRAERELSLSLDADAVYEGPAWLFSVAQRVGLGRGSLSESTTLSAAWSPLPRLRASASYLLSWERGAAFQHALWGYAQAGLWKDYLALRASASAATFDPDDPPSGRERGLAYAYGAGLRSAVSEELSLGYDLTLYAGDRDRGRATHALLAVLSF